MFVRHSKSNEGAHLADGQHIFYHVWFPWSLRVEEDYWRRIIVEKIIVIAIAILPTCRPSLSWILTRRQKWRRINCKSRLLSPTLNANAYEAHNQVRFTTSGVFGTAKLTCANSHTKWLCGESMRGSTPIISLVWSEASDCGTRPSDHLRPSMRYVSYSTPSCDIRTGLTLTRTSLFFDLC